MLKRFIGLAALAGLAVGIGGSMWLHRAAPAPGVAAPLAVLAMPVVPAAAPPAPAPVPVPAAPPPPAADKDSDLPTVVVAQRGIHTVDDNAPLSIPTVTLHQKDGRVIERTAARTAPPKPAAMPVASGGTSFAVAGLPVHLFGIRPPDPRDRCGSGTAAACGDGARAAVAARLGTAGNVRCTAPAGQHGDPGFVCHDASGVDLGGLLVAEGLALADTSSTSAYLSAQNAARSSRRGLWAYR